MIDYSPHPTIRILALMLLAGAAARFSPTAAGLCLALMVIALALIGADASRRFLRGLWRLRWLLFAIFAMFALLDPATASWRWPDQDAVAGAAFRLLPLLLVLAAAVMLLATTPRDRLVEGLLTLLAPLAAVGVPTERFSVRLALTLEAIPQVAERVREKAGEPSGRDRLGVLADRAAALFEQAAHVEDTVEGSDEDRPRVTAPTIIDWIVLAGLAVLVIVLTGLD